jgi:hypothetical protein
MLEKFNSHLSLYLLLIGVVGCYPRLPDKAPEKATGYRPVYEAYEQIRVIQTRPPQPLLKPGKIYIKDNFLFINELGEGFHIFDNTDPAKPTPISFVSIPGNVDVAVKDSILYADNRVDLVALNIANPRNVKLVKRIENAFPPAPLPPNINGWFECPDASKGIVVRWERADLQNPKCYR